MPVFVGFEMDGIYSGLPCAVGSLCSVSELVYNFANPALVQWSRLAEGHTHAMEQLQSDSAMLWAQNI